MTTQDYINEEIQRARSRASQSLVNFPNPQEAQQAPPAPEHPSEVILLRAKVRELTDKLAAERERCAKVVRDVANSGVRDTADCACDDIEARIRSGE